MSEVKASIQEAMKAAMRAKEKDRLMAIRLILAELKQREVDERIELNDEQVIAILDKMIKQRKGAIEQYIQGNREDLADKEQSEITIIQDFLPTQLSEEEVDQRIQEAISNSGAESMKDMGKVMGALKSQLQGRADMSVVSRKIKDKLS